MNIQLNPKRLSDLENALHRHWPNLSNREIQNSSGDFDHLFSLIKSHSSEDEETIRNTLMTILEETQEGNPNSIDEFSGIERAKEGGPPPQTNEWEAREETNQGEHNV